MPAFPASSSPYSDAASAVLKRVYLPGLQQQLNTDTFLMDTLKRVPKHQFRGSAVYLAAKKGLGVTHIVDAGVTDALPPRSTQDYDTLYYDVKELAHRVGFSAMGMDRTKNAPEGAFVNILEEEMGGARDGIGQDMNRQFMGNSSGLLATLTSAITAGSGLAVGSTRFLREGEPICVINVAAGTDISGGDSDNTIVSINSGTLVIVSDVITGAKAVDGIYHRRSTSAPLRNTDMFGIEAIVATANPDAGNLGNVNRESAGKRYWKANLLGNSGTNRPLTTRLLKQGLNIQSRAGGRRGKTKKVGITSDAVALEYGVTLVADKRYPAEFVTLDGGFDALNFAGVPIVWDKDAPSNTLFFVTLDDLMIAEMSPVQFEDRDGSVLFRVADKHQFEAMLYTFTNLVAKRCNSHVVIKDIREDNATHNL